MNYTVSILRRGQRQLAQLPGQDNERVQNAIRDLAETPRLPGCLRLTGRGGWRIRVGAYRVFL